MTANVDRVKDNGNQETTVAALVHIAGLFFGLFATCLVYLVADDEFTKENAANALNWHIPISLMAILVVVVGIAVSEFVGVVTAVILGVATICFALIASLKAYQGRAWEYPIVPKIV